jgi:hypothetical protein
VLAALVREEPLVRLVAHAVVHARGVVLGARSLHVLHGERDPPSVRRPREIAAVVLERRQLPRITALEREHEDVLRLPLLALGLLRRGAVREEREHSSIG